jgi:hypothetical protein
MGFNLPFLYTPYSWFFLSAIAFGAALSRATRGTRREVQRNRAISRKWTMVSIYLSLAVIMAMGGVFIPGAEKVRDFKILYLFIAAAGLSFLVFRFKKAIGLPFALCISVLIILLLLFFRSLTAFTGETEIARVRVLSAQNERMKLEVILHDPYDRSDRSDRSDRKDRSDIIHGEPILITLKGQYFAPIVKVIIFDDLYVFLGTKTWYRFLGMTSFRLEKTVDGLRFRQEDSDHYFERPIGVSEWVYDLFEKYEEKIPGIKTVQVEIDLKKVRETEEEKGDQLETFSIMIQNDGGVQIVRDVVQNEILP